ncbi:MAG TPA: TonB-dependent receptor, partial [Polyangiaceae bacterium]
SDPLHYVNADFPLLAAGVEIGVRREWRQGFMLQASYEFQHTAYLASTSASDLLALRKNADVRNVENSPDHLATLKAAAPILARNLTLATRVTFEGPRYDRYESVTDPAQGRTVSAVLWDLVLSGHEDRWGLRYSLGAYNVADNRYSLPVSNEFSQRAIVQNGRTFLASLDARF